MGRNLTIDIFKIILAFFVVFLHMNFLKESYPTISFLLVNGIFRIAVPVFLTITGFYFLHIDTYKKLQKWLIRTFLLYAIWMLVYISYWKNDEKILLTIIFGYHHLWYLIGTFFSGIILFILRNQKPVLLLILAVFFFAIGYMVQVLGNLHFLKGNSDSVLNDYLIYRNFLFVCFPFLTVGFLINKLNITLDNCRHSYLYVFIAILLVIAEAYFNFKTISSESTDILFSLILVSPLLFLYCQKIYVKTHSKVLASLSTAIYVVHPLIMKSNFYKEITSEFKILIFLLILVAVSVFLVFLNRKLKYLL